MSTQMGSQPIRTRAGQKTAYRDDSAASKQLHERAVRVFPGGNSRHSILLIPYPIYVKNGQGCRVTDVEGEERIDFLNNFTSLILGHANPRVVAAVRQQVAHGSAFTMPTETMVELAELIVERVPYIEQVRFCNSGSEAVLLSVKAARAFTGKPKIAKFEGAYHGLYDYVEVSDGPVPENWGDPNAPASVFPPSTAASVGPEVVILPWNNFKACERLITEHKSELAALVLDPLPAGIGLIAPQPGFLEMLRELTQRYGILLISDEVMSFRLAYDGALAEHRISSDLTALGKIIGGGYPVGAVAGSRQAMSVFDHTLEMKVHHGGTFNANPITMTAGLETMQQMTPEAYERLAHLGDFIREKLGRMLRDRGMPATITGKGSLFLVHFTDKKLVDFRSLSGFSRARPIYGELCHEMLAQGVVISSRGIFGCLSTPMTEAELDAFVDALDKAMTTLQFRPS